MTTTVVLDSEQRDIRDVARSFLEAASDSATLRAVSERPDGFDEARWGQMSELGWPAISLPEAYGGLGYSVVERCLLLEEMGRVLMPSPFLASAVLAADAVACAATPDAQKEILPQIGIGLVRATLAAPGVLGAAPELVEAETPAGSTLSGAAGLVLDGASADLLIVAADTQNGQLGLFAVEGVAAGLERVATPLIDPTRRFARVVLDNVPARRIDRGGETPLALQRAIDHSTVGLAAEMAGAAQRCVELTVAYVRDRKQFGVSIGSFQAIKHRCANMFIDTDAAREAVYMAADVIASDDLQNVGIAASTAKLAASEAFLEAAAAMIQLHGGIGYTWEHDAHLFYKRALLAARMLGSAAEHRARLAAAFDL